MFLKNIIILLGNENIPGRPDHILQGFFIIVLFQHETFVTLKKKINHFSTFNLFPHLIFKFNGTDCMPYDIYTSCVFPCP